MKLDRPILFSVAHSSRAQGAVSIVRDPGVTEYWVSLRASLAALRNLAGEFPVEFLDVGPMLPSEYDDAKVNAINRCQPALAIEIHCNASTDPYPNYSEVIHHRASVEGKRAATCIAKSLVDGFALGHHRKWPSGGARANTVQHDKHLMFFLELTKVPAVIVEGLFLSNYEQARWLMSDGGCEAYGLLVADGVREWIKTGAAA